MKIIIDQTTLTVKNCYPYRYNNGKLVLKIEILKEAIGAGELLALCEELKNNALDIMVVDDAGEVSQAYVGFHHNYNFSADGTQYTVELENESESRYQIGLLKAENAALRGELATLTDNSNMLTECLLEMSEAVYA